MISDRHDVRVELAVGVEHGGELHTTVVLGPLTTRQAFAAEADLAASRPPEFEPDEWRGLCRIARRIRKVGTLPLDTVTVGFLLELAEVDFDLIVGAAKEVEGRIASFRSGGGAAPGVGVPGGEAHRLD